MTDVKLIRHHLKNGKISLYISFYPYFYDRRTGKTIKSENLHMFLISNPKNATERKHNEQTEELAFAIQSKRIIQIRNEEFGFLDTSIRQEDFLAYFEEEVKKRHSKWEGCYRHFYHFCNGVCTFGMLNVDMCKRFREYLLKEARCRQTGKPLNQNSACGYMITFRTIIKQAYVSKMLDTNLNDYFDGIPATKTYKEYLTQDEFKRLSETPCKHEVLKKIALFSIFTGLRISDLETLDWENIVKAPDGGWCIRKEIVKTKRWENVFVSDEAIELIGPRESGKVFKGFRRSMIQHPLKHWIAEAGITKPFSFHCFRHTNATLMIENGVDIYSVSKQLTHQNVQVTQSYADLVDSKRRAAANSISLKNR